MIAVVLPLIAAAGVVLKGAEPANGTHALVQKYVQGPVFDGTDEQFPNEPCAKCKMENLCGSDPLATAGTETCMPVVCRSVCECRIGLPHVPLPAPVAIVPPPGPTWTLVQTAGFCSCIGVRLADCGTELCRTKIGQVQEVAGCKCVHGPPGKIPVTCEGMFVPEPGAPPPTTAPAGP